MIDHLTERELTAFLSGSLGGADAGRVASHLDGCPGCQGLAERLTAVPDGVRATVLAATASGRGHDRPNSVPTIDGYTGLQELGRGGCGVVYQARETATGREVAIKVLRGGVVAAPSECAWFRREARTAAELAHPNVVQIYAVGDRTDLPYYVMEFMSGGSLARRLKGAPVPLLTAAGLIETVARAVHFAHSMGVVHRDLKPGNIMLTDAGPDFGTPKVADFGLAKRLSDVDSLTPTQAVLGTPGYMAPELAAGRAKAAGPSSDVYSLGAILYELLTGRPPFRGATPFDTILHVRTQEPLPPRWLRPDVAAALEAVCLKCLEKRPSRRYGSAELLAEDLARFGRGEPVVARPVGRLRRLARWGRRHPGVAAVVVAASVGGLALAGISRGPAPRELAGPFVPAEPLANANPQPFEPLFNGIDLSGWEIDGNPGWAVKDGAIVTVPGVVKRGWLYTTREFGDFDLRLEFALSPRANSGVAIRGLPGGGGGNRTVLEVQVRDDSVGPPVAVTGSIYINGPDHVDPPTKAALRPMGAWNELRIVARGLSLSVHVNGGLVHEVDLAKLGPSTQSTVHEKWHGEANLRRQRGRIGFQYSPNEIRFRAVEVQELVAR